MNVTIHPLLQTVDRSATAKLYNRLRPIRISMLKSKKHLLTRGTIVKSMKEKFEFEQELRQNHEDADWQTYVDEQRLKADPAYNAFLDSLNAIASALARRIK